MQYVDAKPNSLEVYLMLHYTQYPLKLGMAGSDSDLEVMVW
jgi:hypothetical protein